MEAHCDGSCLGNPGPGGVGIVIIQDNTVLKELSFGEKHTTNNIMELSAVISAISYIRMEMNFSGTIQIFTDSNYVVKGMNTWRHSWKKKNWKNSKGKTVENIDYWKMLDTIGNECTFTHEYGHSGILYNEMADVLAKNAAKEMK